MAITGAVPISSIQGGREATRGTAVAATRVLPIISGTLTQHMEEVQVKEQRGSYFGFFYKPVRVKRWVEIDIEYAPSIEDVIWYNQFGLIGNATPGTVLAPTTTLVTVKRYTYLPLTAQGLTQTATLEVNDGTQDYICSMMVLDRLEYGWSLGGMLTAKAHFIGAKAVSGTRTAGLSAQGTEIFNGSVAKAYIDAGGGTALTTISALPSSMTFSIDNQVALFWKPDGDIVPTDFYHKDSRSMHLESTVRHTADSENAAFLAQTQRLIATKIEGSVATGSTGPVNKSITFYWNGYWSDAPFTDADGLMAQTMTGDSVYDSGTSYDWQVVCDTLTASIV